MVVILVGRENPQPFTVHKGKLCDVSAYFEAELEKLEKNDNDNKDKTLFIQDTIQQLHFSLASPAVFELFMKWLYYTVITDKNGQLPSPAKLVQLWLLAKRIQIPALQNLALKGLHGKSFCHDIAGFQYLYRVTRPEDPLRKYFIDSVICRKMPDRDLRAILNNHWAQLTEEMLKDIIFGLKTHATAVNSGKTPGLRVANYLVRDPVVVEDE
jgi:hypothetical protein